MKMKKLNYFVLAFLAMFTFCTITSCGGDEDLDNGLKGWYISKKGIPKASDFLFLNVAIEENRRLYSSKYTGDVYATRDIFFNSDGSFGNFDYDKGSFEDYDVKKNWELSKEAIRIVDNSTAITYGGGLYDKKMNTKNNVVSFYIIDAGKIFGHLDYMGLERVYTYVKVDNKIILSNGDIYTIVDGGLIKEGSNMSEIMTKYDPNKVY